MSLRIRLASSLVPGIGLILSSPCLSADITHARADDGVEVIGIEGDISVGDEEKFRRLSLQYDKAVVALASDGGALAPAIEIGKMIHLKEFSTIVFKGYRCTSACALIWVAGSKRFLAAGGQVGFHASYQDVGGRKVEKGMGNALVGRYLTLLNLPEKAVLFATAASPDNILWLSPSVKSLAGIDFEFLGPDENPPPIVRTKTPLSRSTSSAASGGSEGWTHVASGESTKYYLDRRRMFRVGQYIAAWELTDERNNQKVKQSESKVLYYYDCRQRSTALKSAIDYDGSGKILESFDWKEGELKWRPVVPDSVGETKLGYVCSSGI